MKDKVMRSIIKMINSVSAIVRITKISAKIIIKIIIILLFF